MGVLKLFVFVVVVAVLLLTLLTSRSFGQIGRVPFYKQTKTTTATTTKEEEEDVTQQSPYLTKFMASIVLHL